MPEVQIRSAVATDLSALWRLTIPARPNMSGKWMYNMRTARLVLFFGRFACRVRYRSFTRGRLVRYPNPGTAGLGCWWRSLVGQTVGICPHE